MANIDRHRPNTAWQASNWPKHFQQDNEQRSAKGSAKDCYCGCGAVAGGGVAGGSSVGVGAGTKYQANTSATTTAAAMMSILFLSIASPIGSESENTVTWHAGTSEMM
jgi:hypothetical protein